MKSLAEQMYVYASYHRHGRNKAFHFVGVPVLTYSILLAFSWLRYGEGLVGFDVSFAMLFVLAVLSYYFALDLGLAVGMILVITPILVAAEYTAQLGFPVSLYAFLGAFVGGWIVQAIGHVFEGRKPALMDNLFQVIVSPIFLLAEVYFALGWKKGVHDEVERLIAERGLYGLDEKGAKAQAA